MCFVMGKTVLVTGANGHLGNNLVRELLRRGYKVKAGMRDINNRDTLHGFDCEIIHADLLDKDSLRKALEGVDILYQVAAVFKHWAQNPEEEIIQPNVIGTRNILEIAKEAQVEKVVYVSSIVALETTETNAAGKIDETTWITQHYGAPYPISKAESEKAAWEIAKELGLHMVTVLPGIMINGEYLKATPSTALLSVIINGKMSISFPTALSLIDVNDVAKGMILAAEKGVNGTRYIMAPEKGLSLARVFEIARNIVPDIPIPRELAKEEALALAEKMELEAKATQTPPVLLSSSVHLYYGAQRDYDLTTTKRDLGFTYRDSEEILEESFKKLIFK